MTSKLVICESESSRPTASSILISRMTSSSVIIPYILLSSLQFNTDYCVTATLGDNPVHLAEVTTLTSCVSCPVTTACHSVVTTAWGHVDIWLLICTCVFIHRHKYALMNGIMIKELVIRKIRLDEAAFRSDLDSRMTGFGVIMLL